MKRYFSLIIFALLLMIPSCSTDSQKCFAAQNAAYTDYADCIRLYKLPYEKLFALAMSSINANNYKILEIQSRNGYVLFDAGGKELVLSVLKKDKTYSYMKIAPADNNYCFSPAIVQKIFNYVDLNFNAELKEIKL